MAVFSAPSRHAMFVLAHMVRLEGEKTSTVEDLSKATGISASTVAKVLLSLVKGGILASKKGPGGGFHMAVPRDQITLGRILYAIEESDPFPDCVANLESCGKEDICPLRANWISVKQMLVDFLDSAALQEVGLQFLRKNK